MNLKKKFLLLILFFIIIFQVLLYANNNQKTSFRYFKWTTQELSIGKLISISFFSGLLISTFLNSSLNSKRNTLNNAKEDYENVEESYPPLKNEEDKKSTIEMPPERDIRDSQPTISVNYRVVKNIEENNLKRDKNYSNITDNQDDWDCEDNDW